MEIKRIHILQYGYPICGFSDETPDKWPPGHRWATIDDAEASGHPLFCRRCRDARDLREHEKRIQELRETGALPQLFVR
jgi:hypothetical protein